MRRQLMIAVGTIALAACSTTITDPGTDVDGAEPAVESLDPIEGGVSVDPDAPQPTVPLTGSAADLLPEMSIEMSRLGSQVAEGGDDDATLERIEQIWERIRPEIEAERPELLNGLSATIDMARVAVDRTRPADADKAFGLLTDLVDQFTGDG